MHITMNQYDACIDSLYRDQIYFMSNSNLQKERWGNSHGELPFVGLLIRFFSDWDTIVEYRKECNLYPGQFEKMKDLYDLVYKFQMDIPYPVSPKDYNTILNSPEWKNIQHHAQALYNEYVIRFKNKYL